jgi:hypothetical protein
MQSAIIVSFSCLKYDDDHVYIPFNPFNAFSMVLVNKRFLLLCRKGVPQPDNEEGIREGPIKVDNNIGKAWCRLATTTLVSTVVGWQQQN